MVVVRGVSVREVVVVLLCLLVSNLHGLGRQYTIKGELAWVIEWSGGLVSCLCFVGGAVVGV